MHSPIELALHKVLDDFTVGKKTMSSSTINAITKDIKVALKKQFVDGKPGFRFRLSSLGKPSCQLWFDKNKPETALPKPSTFIFNMILGDILEAVFKGFLREANVEFKDSSKVTLALGKDKIAGTYDLVIDNDVDDIKTASDWSYRNKFDSFSTLKENDSFGYIGQLSAYAKAGNYNPGGWWVINKNNCSFKYVPATGIEIEKEITILKNTVDKVKENKFERCFDAVNETFRGKETGNKILDKTCSFCSYRKECWSDLKELPSLSSKAKEPKIVSYVYIKE